MDLTYFLSERSIAYAKDVPLPQKTWIKTGGICECWVMPQSVEQLTKVCRFLYENNIDFDILGQTSNIFFHPTYNPQGQNRYSQSTKNLSAKYLTMPCWK